MSQPRSLLTLPGELRNLIYEYSLTYPNALYVVDNLTEPISEPTFHALGLQDAQSSELNQLQYVNRQLQKETVGLELKHNSICFQRLTNNGLPCGARLVSFLQLLPPKFLPWLSKITVDESFELGKGPFFHDSNATTKLLDQLCNQNPRLEIEYLVPAWCVDVAGDDSDWLSSILTGVCHFYGIRGDFKTHISNPEVQDIVAMHVTNKPS